MTRLSRYSEAFWGAEFTSTAGFDALSQRMKDGRNMCKDFEDYLKLRYEMEKRYHGDLINLLKKMKHREETGVLEKSWNRLREEVEKMAVIHSDSHQHFHKQMEEVKRFIDSLNTKRRAIDDQMKRSQDKKNSAYSLCMKNQKTYKEKCRDKDTACDNYTAMKSSVTTLAKELDKATKNRQKAEEESYKAESNYKSSVDSLETSRTYWEKEMHESCETIQKLDEERIRFLRECLWASLNIDSQCAVDIDNCCESVRQVLESCKVEEDISNFIARYKTGTERPAAIAFDNYYTNVDTGRLPVQRSGGQRGRNGAATLATSQRLSSASMKASRPPRPDACVEPSYIAITRSHKAQNVNELTVEVGQRVRFIRKMENMNIQVQLEGTNKFGIIPSHCIEQFL